MESGNDFIALRKFALGKITKDELMDLVPLIANVHVKQPLGESVITIEYDYSETVLKLLDLTDDDIWFIQVIDSPYSNFEFIDYYTVQEDFLEGYGLWNQLDNENIELLKKIAQFIYPKKFDLDNSEFVSELGRKLLTTFRPQTEDIMDDYRIYRNRQMRKSASESIEEELDREIEKKGFSLQRYDGLRTTASNLISLYAQYGILWEPIKKIIKTTFKDSSLGGYYENSYEYADDREFDSDGFNSDVRKNLEKIYEKLTEDIDEVKSKEFFKKIDKITSEFEVDEWHGLPKDKRVLFKILNFNFEDFKIVIEIRNPKTLQIKEVQMSEQNFNNLLYHPELFDLSDI